MSRLLLTSILSLLLAPVWANAQTSAEDYFHKGAQYYIFGEKTNAAKAIYTGLRVYPSDVKLNEVAKLLAKKEPENKNQSKSDQQQQKQEGDKDKDQKQQKGQKSDQKDQESQPQKSDDGKSPDDKKGQSKDQKKSDADKKKEAQKANPEEGDDKSKEEAAQEAAMMAAGQMTPTQAKQLLDAAKGDDQILRIVPPNKQNRPARSFKDW